MKRAILGAVALALTLIAVAVGVMAQTGSASPSKEEARVRFIHASPDAPAVDVLLAESTVFTSVAFSEWTEYIDIATGTYTVSIQLSSASTPVLTDAVVLTETDYTLTAAGTVASGGRPFELLSLFDDNSAPPAGMVRGRFIHLVPDGPQVDIALEGTVLFENVAYRDATDYVTVPPGTHTLQIRTPIGEVTTTATAQPNNVYSFVAVGRVIGSPELNVLKVLDESYNHPIWLPIVAATTS